MKILKVTTLLSGALLLLGLGSTNLLAVDSKCGAGKCGDAKKEVPAASKSGAGKCGDAKKEVPAASKCGAKKKEAPKSTGKCGVGKCG